jgi:hypothetical protein
MNISRSASREFRSLATSMSALAIRVTTVHALLCTLKYIWKESFCELSLVNMINAKKALKASGVIRKTRLQ